MQHKFPFDLDTVMPFGKHKGKTLRDIAMSTPGYIRWMRDNISEDIVTDAVWKLAVNVGILESEIAAERYGTASDYGFDEF